MNTIIDEIINGLSCGKAVSKEAVDQFEKVGNIHLPKEYLNFLERANGAEGPVGANAYVMLWPLEEILELNRAYEVAEYAPGLLLFGSDGGGEAFAFDTRSPEMPVVRVPFVGMDHKEVRQMGRTFTEFLGWLYRS